MDEGLALGGEEFDEVAEFVFGEYLAEFFGHAGEGAVAGVDFGFIEGDVAVFGVVDGDLRVGFFDDFAGETAAVFEGDCDVFPTFGEFVVGHDDGFEEVAAGLARADFGEVGAGFAAFGADFVAARTEDFGAFVEDAAAFGGVSALEGFGEGGEWIVLRAVCFEALNAVENFARLALAGGVEEIELEFGNESVLEKAVEFYG